MTTQKSEIELEKAAMVKRIRSRVRVEAANEADRRLNELLPEAERLFDESVQKQQELPSGREIESVVFAQELA